VSLFSDARFRGYSLSDGHPVASADLSYDDIGGAYAAVSASTVGRSDGLRPLALQLNGGYAKSLSSGLSLDFGIVHSRYARYSSAEPGRSDTEIYAGFSRQSLSGRLYLSPHYFESGTSVLYGELIDAVEIAPELRLSGHVGLLTPIRRRGGSETRPNLDWRLGLTRELNAVSLHAAWTGRTRSSGDSGDERHGGNALVFGIRWVL